MKIAKIALIAAAVLALGFLLCPATPGEHEVDPNELLRKVLGPQPPTPQLRISLIERNYTPLVEGHDTIAGRPVWTLRLKPSCKHFPWMQLWIDKETGVVLAYRDWTGRNTIKHSARTTAALHNSAQLSGDMLDVAASSVLQLPDPRADLRAARRVLGRVVPTPRYVPACFELVAVEVDTTSRDVHLVYSDGLYALSVFVGPPVDRAARTIEANRAYELGPALAFLTRAQGAGVLIVADLPVEELEKIAGSIE